MSYFRTQQEIAEDRGQAPVIRARGSRLEPGEVEEIAFLAERGHRHQITDQQVLGLIETIHSLARRCSIRFQEATELRAKLTEMIEAEAEAQLAEAGSARVLNREDLIRQRDAALREADAERRQVEVVSAQLHGALTELKEARDAVQPETLALEAIADLVRRESVTMLLMTSPNVSSAYVELTKVVESVREIIARRENRDLT